MSHGHDHHQNLRTDRDRASDRTPSDVRENLESPMVFALWVAGLFGIGAAAFVLSALVSAH